MRISRFRLRTLLLLPLVVAMYLAICNARTQYMRRWNQTIDELESEDKEGWSFGTELTYPNAIRFGTRLVDRLLTREQPREIIIVNSWRGKLEEKLVALQNAGVVSIGALHIAPQGEHDIIECSPETLQHLKRFKVRSVFLCTRTPVEKELFQGLLEMRGIEEVSVYGDWITDDLFEGLKRENPSLYALEVTGFVTPALKTKLANFAKYRVQVESIGSVGKN